MIKKVAILLPNAAPKRFPELSLLDIRFIKSTPEYHVFRISGM